MRATLTQPKQERPLTALEPAASNRSPRDRLSQAAAAAFMIFPVSLSPFASAAKSSRARGLAKIVVLEGCATQPVWRFDLGGCFDPLSQNLDLQPARQLDHRLADRVPTARAVDVGHKLPVDLQLVEGKRLQGLMLR